VLLFSYLSFFFSSRRRHTRFSRDWSSDVGSSDLLLFAYAFDDGPVKVIDIKQGEQLPAEVMEALIDPAVVKTAFNANFERVTINRHFGIPTPPEQWSCTMVHSLMLGLPGSLEGVGKALRLDVQK